jgi:hypothetical protein
MMIEMVMVIEKDTVGDVTSTKNVLALEDVITTAVEKALDLETVMVVTGALAREIVMTDSCVMSHGEVMVTVGVDTQVA